MDEWNEIRKGMGLKPLRYLSQFLPRGSCGVSLGRDTSMMAHGDCHVGCFACLFAYFLIAIPIASGLVGCIPSISPKGCFVTF